MLDIYRDDFAEELATFDRELPYLLYRRSGNRSEQPRVLMTDLEFSDVADMDGLRDSVLEAKALGFDGKGCIHPRQIPVVHEAFAPTTVEANSAPVNQWKVSALVALR